MATIDLITDKVFHVWACTLLIAVCYAAPLFYIKVERKDKILPAKKSEKAAMWVSSVLVLAFAIWLYSSNFKNTLSEFISDFIITFIPMAFGIFHAFQKDAKLTLKDRRRIKYEIDNSKGRDELS